MPKCTDDYEWGIQTKCQDTIFKLATTSWPWKPSISSSLQVNFCCIKHHIICWALFWVQSDDSKENASCMPYINWMVLIFKWNYEHMNILHKSDNLGCNISLLLRLLMVQPFKRTTWNVHNPEKNQDVHHTNLDWFAISRARISEPSTRVDPRQVNPQHLQKYEGTPWTTAGT